MNTTRWITAMAAFVLVAGTGSAAMAAAQAEGMGPGMPPPSDRGFEGRGGMPRRMPLPPITAATIPVSAMKSYLNLTDTQHGKIADITDDLRDQLRPTPPRGGPGRPGGPDEDGGPGGVLPGRPGGPGEDGGGPDDQRPGRPAGPDDEGGGYNQRPEPPAGEGRETRRAHADAAIKKANQAIESVLNDDQKKKLPTLLQALSALQADHIQLDAVAKLKLTDDQMTKLAALGKTATGRKVDRIFSDEQVEIAERYRMPAGGPGGRFAGGPPPRGGSQGFRRPQGGPPNGGPSDGGYPGGPPNGGPPGGGPPNGGPPQDGQGPPPGDNIGVPQQ